ncbi:MAG: hypothetical protein ACKVT2_19910 [Saprospiraceae bacterium]
MNFTQIALLVLCATNASAQPGCPDPQATNFNALATENDGSCLYPITNYTPGFKSNLPNDLQEISGLVKSNSKWWGHNDSGFEESFFSLNPETGNILQKIKLDNAHNRDWEDIATDGQNLYVGDFGNNQNSRQNLGVYIVPHSEIGNSNSETVQEFEWSFLPFSYVDQTDFTSMPDDSSVFDCEAMIYYVGKIHLFTKSRRFNQSAHYAINASTNVAEKLETFDTQGLITGAALSPDGKLVALVGYDLRPFIPTVFCWLLWDWQPGTDLFFTGNKRRIELGTALQIGQVESIGFDTDRAGYISNEITKFNGVTIVPESVWGFDFSPWAPLSVGTAEQKDNPEAFSVFPNPFSQTVQFQYSGDENPDFFRIKNQLGQIVFTLNEIPNTLDLGFLPSGNYTFETWRNGRQVGWGKGVRQ